MHFALQKADGQLTVSELADEFLRLEAPPGPSSEHPEAEVSGLQCDRFVASDAMARIKQSAASLVESVEVSAVETLDCIAALALCYLGKFFIFTQCCVH